MSDLVVRPQTAPLVGSVPVPGDKSITHRALMLAAVAEGTSRIRGGLLGEDNLATLAALRALGVTAREEGGVVVVEGVGLLGLRAPSAPIDCGNSGTTMRLLAGLLVGQRFETRLAGDASLSLRPMERVARPLRLRGGRIEGQIDPRRVGEITAPLVIGPLPEPLVLSTLEIELPIASAQVKSAILLSGLYADGATFVREPHVSRDHTERMLHALGVPIRSVGALVHLDGPSWSGVLPAFELSVPGDLSAAAFLLCAAQIVPQSRVDVRGVLVNPSRTGLLEILRDMGGRFGIEAKGEELGEPIGDLQAESSELSASEIGGERVTRAIDEIPIACALAARARGVTTLSDARELRAKESDRLAAMARVLRAFSVRCEERDDGLVIEGRPDGALTAADIDSGGDHRIAMTAAILGLVADGSTRVRDVDCIATSFPRFVGTLRALGASIDVVASDSAGPR